MFPDRLSEAKIHLLQLLDEVEDGETLVITRHGRAIARIVPEPARRQEEIDRAIEGIKRLRQRTGRITVESFCLPATRGTNTDAIRP